MKTSSEIKDLLREGKYQTSRYGHAFDVADAFLAIEPFLTELRADIECMAANSTYLDKTGDTRCAFCDLSTGAHAALCLAVKHARQNAPPLPKPTLTVVL